MKLLRTLTTIAIIVGLGASQAGFAQGKGGGAGQRGGGTQQNPPPAGQGQRGTAQGTQDRTQIRIHATDQQRDQLKTCDQTADRVRAQAKTLAGAAKGSSATTGDFIRYRDQLRDQIRTLEQDHDRLMNGLGAEQKTALKERIRDMGRERDRLNTQLQQMDGELQNANPNRTRVAEQARNMEQAMSEWQKQYRTMQGQMNP